MIFIYKNIGTKKLIFRAAKSAENPNEKKLYEVEAGKEIELPVKIDAQLMEFVKEILIEKEELAVKRKQTKQR